MNGKSWKYGDNVNTDEISVDIGTSRISNITSNKEYSFTPFADEMKGIIKAGGLMEYIKSNNR